MNIDFTKVDFVTSVHNLGQLPEAEFPEVAFAGRSNVGKSSLLNKLMNRRNLVKISSRPGKTQGLNYYLVENACYLVDLPGYGYAKAPKKLQEEWGKLIADYLANRSSLRAVAAILDLRHPLKTKDTDLISWLVSNSIRYLPIYTKADKLTRNEQNINSRRLDKELGIQPADRIIFSAKTGLGREELIARLAEIVGTDTME